MFFTLVVLHKDCMVSLQHSFENLILMRRLMSGNREGNGSGLGSKGESKTIHRLPKLLFVDFFPAGFHRLL